MVERIEEGGAHGESGAALVDALNGFARVGWAAVEVAFDAHLTLALAAVHARASLRCANASVVRTAGAGHADGDELVELTAVWLRDVLADAVVAHALVSRAATGDLLHELVAVPAVGHGELWAVDSLALCAGVGAFARLAVLLPTFTDLNAVCEKKRSS